MLKKGAHARCANCSIPDDHSAQKLLTKHTYAHALEASSFYDTIDAYVFCAIVLVVLTYGLDAIALVRGRFRG